MTHWVDRKKSILEARGRGAKILCEGGGKESKNILFMSCEFFQG